MGDMRLRCGTAVCAQKAFWCLPAAAQKTAAAFLRSEETAQAGGPQQHSDHAIVRQILIHCRPCEGAADDAGAPRYTARGLAPGTQGPQQSESAGDATRKNGGGADGCRLERLQR